MSTPQQRHQFPLANLLSVYSHHPFVKAIQQRTNAQQSVIHQPLQVNPSSKPMSNPPMNPTVQSTAPPPQQTGRRYLLTGARLNDIGHRMRAHPFFNREIQSDKGQQVDRPQATINSKWNRCPNCRRIYQPYHAKTCPECGYSIPNYIRNAKPTGNTDMAFSTE